MTALVYIDCETTGLDPDLHDIWEVAWTINDNIQVESRILSHQLQTADPEALRLNKYWDRAPWGMQPEMNHDFDLEFKEILTGNTIVAANPAFDASFLRSRWGTAPWHYRMIDVESMALAVLMYERPKGLAGITEDLISIGYNIREPDHSARGDVMTLRDCYTALRYEQKKLREGYSRMVYTEDVLRPIQVAIENE